MKNNGRFYVKRDTQKRRMKRGKPAKKTDCWEDVSTHLEEIPDEEWQDEPITLEDKPNQTMEGRKDEAFLLKRLD
jgi:hypothetical protein